MANIKFSGGTGNTNPTTGQQYVLTKEGLQGLAAATITKITGPDVVTGGKKITIYTGAGTSQELGVGSNITAATDHTNQNKGTVRLVIDGSNLDVPVQGLTDTDIGSASTPFTNGYIKNLLGGDTPGNIGSSSKPFANGYFTNLTVGGNAINADKLNSAINGSPTNPTTVFWRGDGTWSNELTGPLSITNTANGVTPDNTTATSYTANTAASIHTNGGIYAAKDIWARRVFNAVFNDYAEYRTTINLEPGRVVVDQDDGSLACASARLQPGAQVISDTFGHSMGETNTAKTPIAVAGRVLIYPYQARENYHAGMAVCSAPDGTVDIMTREEIRDYPDCIVGIVSEIPQYETWGSDNVKVDGRIWVRIK